MEEEFKNREDPVAIIDGDGLIYHACKDDIHESIQEVDKRMQNIFDKVSDKYILAITISKFTFRNKIYKEYKETRKLHPTSLKWIKTLKNYLIDKYGAIFNFECEADDIVAYFKAKLENKGIICSPDKDLLKNIKGKHFNYTYFIEDEIKKIKKEDPTYVIKDEDLIKGFFIETNAKEATRNFFQQMLEGDRGDNIKGLEDKTQYIKERYGLDNRKGLGASSANKILDIIEEKFEEKYASEILNCYISYYGEKGIEMFNLNYRLLKMIDNDEDMFKFTNTFYDEAEKYICYYQKEILDLKTESKEAF